MASIQQARAEVDRCVETALATAAREGSAAEVERRLWSMLLALGRALMTLSFATGARSWEPRGRIYECHGRRYAVVGQETPSIGTRFGKVELQRPVGRAIGQAREPEPRDLPLDRELGLPGGFTIARRPDHGKALRARAVARQARAAARPVLVLVLGPAAARRR